VILSVECADVIDLTKPYDCAQPIWIGGRAYVITPDNTGVPRDGSRLWTVAVALAEHAVDVILSSHLPPTERRCCAVGDGLGLIGIVAADCLADVTIIDRDGETLTKWTLSNVVANKADLEIREADWHNAEGVFDFIFGSEVLYSTYGLHGLCAFIDRTWTRKGECWFVNSKNHDKDRFQDAAEQVGLTARFRTLAWGGSECYLWRVTQD
jgi:hypothetical protein